MLVKLSSVELSCDGKVYSWVGGVESSTVEF